jgi:hypothetical protein
MLQSPRIPIGGDCQRTDLKRDDTELIVVDDGSTDEPGKSAGWRRWNYIDSCEVYRRSIWEQNRRYDGTMSIQGGKTGIPG